MNIKRFFNINVFIWALVAGVHVASANPVFVFRQADGTLRFSTTKPADVEAEVFTAKGAVRYGTLRGGVAGKGSPKLFPLRYDAIIKGVAQRYQVDPALVKAVIHAESRFNPRAISRKGAMGLMQLMPTTAKMLGVRQPLAISDNINGGVKYLAQLLKRYNGNVIKSVAAYNAGAGAVDSYGGIPPYRETRGYVAKVIELMRKYREI